MFSCVFPVRLCLWSIWLWCLKFFHAISVREKMFCSVFLLIWWQSLRLFESIRFKFVTDGKVKCKDGKRDKAIPRHKGPGSLVMMLLWATILSTIFIKGTQIDTKRQEPGAVAEHAGGHLHARVQRQTLTHSLSLFQRSLSPSTHHWSPSGTNTASSLSVSRLYTSACDTNLRPASWSACVVVTVSRVSLKSIQMYYSHVL